MTESKNNKKEEIKTESHPTDTNIESKGADSQKECNSCHQKIHISAKVCQHCGQSQNRYMRFFQTIPILVPLVIAIIAGLQLYQAHQKNVDASEALEMAKTAAKDANEALAQVISDATEINWLKTVTAAQGGDGVAYDQLGKWARDVSFPFRTQAQQVHDKIREDHSQAIYMYGFNLTWKEGVDPNKLTFERLKQEFLSANQDPYLRRALLEYIWQRNDIPKILRLDFMVDVMKTDKHLTVREYAGRYFTQGVGLKIKPLAKDRLINWWADNRSEFEEKPDPNKSNK